MEKSSLFQYVVLRHPSKEEYEKGRRSELLGNVVNALAKDAKSAALIAAMSIPGEHKEVVDQLEIIVRPF